MGFAARYLLRTDILSTLKEAGVRIVILTPNPDEPYMAKEFSDSGVLLERLRVDWTDVSLVTASRMWSLLFYLRKYTLAGGHRSEALQDKYADFDAMVRARSRFLAACFRLALNGLWRSHALRRLLLDVETRLFTRAVHDDLFDRYEPHLVVTTSPGWFFPDAVVLREAHARGVASATLILSWDNPTSKGYRGAEPEQTIVWSDEMARQIAEHHDYPRAQIRVAGVPHFDHYVREDELLTREELCEQLGLEARPEPGGRALVHRVPAADRLVALDRLAQRDGEPLGHVRGDDRQQPMSAFRSAVFAATTLLLFAAASANASHLNRECSAPQEMTRFTVRLPNTGRAIRNFREVAEAELLLLFHAEGTMVCRDYLQVVHLQTLPQFRLIPLFT